MEENREERGTEKRPGIHEAGLTVTYRRNLRRSHMYIREQGTVERHEVKMLEGRQVPHLLKVETSVVEGETYYLYDISGKQQIEDYLSGKKMGYEILWQLLFSIRELCRVLPDYLLREEGVCLREEYIYMNLEDGSLYFTYLPFWQESLTESFERYMEGVLRKTDHQDQEARELAYQVYQMCLVENTSIHKILEAVTTDKKKEEPGLEKRDKPAAEYFSEEEAEEAVKEKRKLWEQAADRINGSLSSIALFSQLSEQLEKLLKKEPIHLKHKISGQEKKADKRKKFCSKGGGKKWFRNAGIRSRKEETPHSSFDETSAPNRKAFCLSETSAYPAGTGEGKTGEWGMKKEKAEEYTPVHPTEILAVRGGEPVGKLMYQGIHGCQDIFITGDEFLIGKNRQQAQGIIEAQGVSRLHARISRQEMRYYLEDLNSTNGTYLNEVPLEYHQKKELCRNDRVRFGLEEYLFF